MSKKTAKLNMQTGVSKEFGSMLGAFSGATIGLQGANGLTTSIEQQIQIDASLQEPMEYLAEGIGAFSGAVAGYCLARENPNKALLAAAGTVAGIGTQHLIKDSIETHTNTILQHQQSLLESIHNQLAPFTTDCSTDTNDLPLAENIPEV